MRNPSGDARTQSIGKSSGLAVIRHAKPVMGTTRTAAIQHRLQRADPGAYHGPQTRARTMLDKRYVFYCCYAIFFCTNYEDISQLLLHAFGLGGYYLELSKLIEVIVHLASETSILCIVFTAINALVQYIISTCF